jgi:hypothetical protein
MIDQNKATTPQRVTDIADAPLLPTGRLPGRRDGLPAGALGGVPVEPQGDENRDPPANAPTIPE